MDGVSIPGMDALHRFRRRIRIEGRLQGDVPPYPEEDNSDDILTKFPTVSTVLWDYKPIDVAEFRGESILTEQP